MVKQIIIRPQAGMQMKAAASTADITILGSGAGTGKSWLLNLLAAVPGYKYKEYTASVFRRLTTELRGGRGIFDESYKIMPYLGGMPSEHRLLWRFRSGAGVEYHHCQYESDVHSYQSKQFARILLDEATQFTAYQIWYLLSRLRSLAPVRKRMYMSCNPDPDSLVADLIAWYIDDNGLPIPERCGKLRYFVRNPDNDELFWGDSFDHLFKETGKKPLSLTFIPGSLSENKILEKADPEYRKKLENLTYVERQRLLHGNWHIRETAGLLFKRSWVSVVPELPEKAKGARVFRCWDLASSGELKKDGSKNTGARTAGVKACKHEGIFYILDSVAKRESPAGVEALIKNTAIIDGKDVAIRIWRDPGQSSVAQEEHYTKNILDGFDCKFEVDCKDKIAYFNPVSSCAENGHMVLVNGAWVSDYCQELEGFPKKSIKDQVDATSLAWIFCNEENFSFCLL